MLQHLLSRFSAAKCKQSGRGPVYINCSSTQNGRRRGRGAHSGQKSPWPEGGSTAAAVREEIGEMWRLWFLMSFHDHVSTFWADRNRAKSLSFSSFLWDCMVGGCMLRRAFIAAAPTEATQSWNWSTYQILKCQSCQHVYIDGVRSILTSSTVDHILLILILLTPPLPTLICEARSEQECCRVTMKVYASAYAPAKLCLVLLSAASFENGVVTSGWEGDNSHAWNMHHFVNIWDMWRYQQKETTCQVRLCSRWVKASLTFYYHISDNADVYR